MGFQLVLTGMLLNLCLHMGSSDLIGCKGDILLLLDSSSSVSNFEFFHMVNFIKDFVQPFSLGPDQVRIALLQVGTAPHLDFDFEAYESQQDLQTALQRIHKLGGDTNTVDALVLAKERTFKHGIPGGAREGVPRVLIWITDGVEPGNVQSIMEELREDGIYVLVVSTGQGNYQLLRDAVSPPAAVHLYFVDVEDMGIITDDLQNALSEIICAGSLLVRDITSSTAELHWTPVLAGKGYYDIRFGPLHSGNTGGQDGEIGISPGTAGGHYQRIIQPGESSSYKLTNLRPDTTYNVTLIPQSDEEEFNKLHTIFTTRPDSLPEMHSPERVMVSDSTVNSVRVSWGPLQPELVQMYQVEYSTLPTGKLHVLTLNNRQNSTLLANLQPGTQYLVTVSASYLSGREKALSVKVCTQEVLPALSDLDLTLMDNDSVLVKWKGGAEGLRGYWVTWEAETRDFSRPRSTLYLPPHLLSTTLKHIPHNARICVSPVYKSARGEGLCCNAHQRSAALTWSQKL